MTGFSQTFSTVAILTYTTSKCQNLEDVRVDRIVTTCKSKEDRSTATYSHISLLYARYQLNVFSFALILLPWAWSSGWVFVTNLNVLINHEDVLNKRHIPITWATKIITADIDIISIVLNVGIKKSSDICHLSWSRAFYSSTPMHVYDKQHYMISSLWIMLLYVLKYQNIKNVQATWRS